MPGAAGSPIAPGRTRLRVFSGAENSRRCGYRGSMPEWNGIYLYGDYCTGYIWGLTRTEGGNNWQNQLLFETNQRINSFGQDESGELYFVSDSGEIYKLIPN